MPVDRRNSKFLVIWLIAVTFTLIALKNSMTAEASKLTPTSGTIPEPQTCIHLNASNLPTAIIDSHTISSTIDVKTSFPIYDVNVHNFSLKHGWVSDLRTYLISPQGTKVALFLNTGGSGKSFEKTIFDNSGMQNIQDGTAPFTGTYSPVESLSNFINERSNGRWTLQIQDINKGDEGALQSWQLELCAKDKVQIDPADARLSSELYLPLIAR